VPPERKGTVEVMAAPLQGKGRGDEQEVGEVAPWPAGDEQQDRAGGARGISSVARRRDPNLTVGSARCRDGGAARIQALQGGR
jgi:hypothetical protein